MGHKGKHGGMNHFTHLPSDATEEETVIKSPRAGNKQQVAENKQQVSENRHQKKAEAAKIQEGDRCPLQDPLLLALEDGNDF